MPTAAPPDVRAVVRNGFLRRRPPRDFLASLRRSLSACITPPAFFTIRCHEDSFRGFRLRRPLLRPALGPGFSVASHINFRLLYLWSYL